MDKTIILTGINRALPSQLTPDGACQEIINLRLRKGAWRPVGRKKLYRGMQGENFNFIVLAGITHVFLHDIDNSLLAGVPNWIGYNRLTGELSLLDLTLKTLTHLETLPAQTDIKVVFLKRTMIVTCASFMGTYLWASDKHYAKVSTLPVPEVTLSVIEGSESEHWGSVISSSHQAVYGDYLTTLDEANRYDGSLSGSLVYIAAYRLFDGSYFLHSIPRYVEIKNTGLVTTHMLTQPDPTDPTYYMRVDMARIKATVKDNYTQSFESTKDLVDSVCIFATRATTLHRIDDSTISEQGFLDHPPFIDTPPSRVGEYDFKDFFPLSEEFKDLCKSESFYLIHEFPYDTLVEGEGDITEDVDTKGYYKNYSTRETLTTDQMSHHSMQAKVAMVYNDRLHLYNIKNVYGAPYIQWQAPEGMIRITDTPGTISVWMKTALGQVVINAPIMVPRYADDSHTPVGGDVTVQVVLQFPDEPNAINFTDQLNSDPAGVGYPRYVAGSAVIEVLAPDPPGATPRATVTFSHVTVVQNVSYETYYYLPPIIGYNDSRAYKMQLVVGDNDGFMFEDKLTKNPGMNYSFWRNPNFHLDPTDPNSNYKFRNWPFSHVFLPGTIPQGVTTGFDTNRLQASEIQNPLVFPTRYSYQVGTGDGLALAAASKPLSTGQFGQFPLQAFSSKGIWALEIGNGDLLYSHVLPVNGEVINNPDNVISIGEGVVYTTERGLFLLMGMEVRELSEAVEGAIDLAFINLPDVQGACSAPNFIALSGSLSQIQFLQYISESRIGYDQLNREIFITNKNFNYSYVFSIESATWTKVSVAYTLLVNSYPQLLGFTPLSCVNISEEDETLTVDTLFITRPLSLDAPDYFKKIERCVLRAECSPSSGKYAGWYLFGSDDLNNWQFITGIQRTGQLLQDLLFQRSNGSAKYYILVFASNTTPQGEISRIDVNYTPRWTQRLR